MKLYAGTDSTWSLRVLVCLEIIQMDIQTELFDLSNEADTKQLKQFSPSGLVPLLQDGDLLIHDSLAIVEYLNELRPGVLYPADRRERAIARSLCAEMHSGYLSVRGQLPFSASGHVAAVIPSAESAAEIRRTESLFATARGRFIGGDTPSVVDAFFSAMAYRLRSYGIIFSGTAGKYQQSLAEWDVFQKALAKIASSQV